MGIDHQSKGQAIESTGRRLTSVLTYTNPSFSVIIPTLNEAELIGKCVSDVLSAKKNVEVIVADGGSRDATTSIARRAGATVLDTEPGRGLQCNRGAAIASGNLLIFLHADTTLPEGAFDYLSQTFERDEIQIGNFGIIFDARHWVLRLLSFLVRFDRGFFRFGDQGLVIRKTLFNNLGGFPDQELFEDLEFVRRARKLTRIYRFPLSVTTSARRFRQNGIIRQQLKNVYYTVQYMLGVSSWNLAEKYYGLRPGLNRKSLVILLRVPAYGKVKTRLAKTLGPQKAQEFYSYCVEHLLAETEKLPHHIIKYIYYTPANAGESVRNWAGRHFRFQPQVGGSLGKRLKTIFHEQFQSGIRQVIIVATDVPELSATDIEEAFVALDKDDLVLGPSTDGGYYLIGMKEPHPNLFKGIFWSTDAVYNQTMEVIDQLGLSVYNLRSLDDIDTEYDLRRWQQNWSDKMPLPNSITTNLRVLK